MRLQSPNPTHIRPALSTAAAPLGGAGDGGPLYRRSGSTFDIDPRPARLQ